MGETRLPAVAVNSVLTSISGFSDSISRLRISVSVTGLTEEKTEVFILQSDLIKINSLSTVIPWSPNNNSALDQSRQSEIRYIIVTYFKELSSSYFLASGSLEEKRKVLGATCCHIIRGVPKRVSIERRHNPPYHNRRTRGHENANPSQCASFEALT